MKVLWFIMVVAVLTSEGIHLAAAAKPSGHSDNPEAVKYYGYQPRQHRLLFVEMLMKNPYGVHKPPPGCPIPSPDSDNSNPWACPSGSTVAANGDRCTATCIDPDYGSCPGTPPACTDLTATCTNGNFVITDGNCGCFTGDTMVVIRESDSPVAIKDMQVGQHVQCMDSGADLTNPTSVQWCEVMNWVHVDRKTQPVQRLTFARPDKSAGSIKVTKNHLIMRLTSDTPLHSTAAQMNAFGPFETVRADSIQAGDKIVLLTNPKDPSAGFFVAAVANSEEVDASGIYNPAIEMPYIIAEGVVVPLYVDLGIPITASPVNGYQALMLQYLSAPVFMKKYQPAGTRGTQGTWPLPGGKDSVVWPHLMKLLQVVGLKAPQGLVVDFAALQGWFMPRYKAWKADPSAVVSPDEAINAFSSLWVPGTDPAKQPIVVAR